MSWTPEALAAAIGVLAAAMTSAAVLCARTYVQVANILQGLHRAGVPMRGGQGAALLRSSANAIGGARGDAAARPPWVPNWNQLNDPLPTGQQDPASITDCGEECVAECVYAVKGVPMTAGDIRFLLGGAARAGTTTADDLVRAFTICHVMAKAASLEAAAARAAIASIVTDQRVAIILGQWVTIGLMHWVVVWRVDPDGLMVNDPWGGRRRKIGWSDFTAHYGGWLVEVLERGVYDA